MKNLISRRTILLTGAAAVAAPALIGRATAASSPVLVELFTSQGCSSCPPADKLAGELAKHKDVIMVSLNVDYWDYLGWHDTLAKPEYTKRQRAYANSRGDGQVYTPQMVANGALHAVGSNRSSVTEMIASARNLSPSVRVDVEANATEVRVEIGKGTAGEAKLWLMSVAPSVSVKIERGENSGSTVTYHNVVRSLVPAGVWTGKAASFTLPRVGPVIGLSRTSLTQA
jgi:hypothetical protein